MNGDWNYSQLGAGYEFYFRPLENFVFFVFLKLFGINPLFFRIFKAIFAAGIFCLVYYYIKKYSGSKEIALLGSIFNITAPGVLASIFLIYDFEIVMQLIVLMVTLFFINVVENKDEFEKLSKFNLKKMILFLLLIYLAVLTKESSKIFILVIVLTLLLWNYKNVKIIVLCLILLFLALKPGVLLGLNSHSESLFMTMSQWFSLENLTVFVKTFLICSFGVVSALICLLLINFRKIKSYGLNFRLTRISFFWLTWFFLASVSAVFVPMIEVRYLAVQFLPFTLLAFTFIGKKFSEQSVDECIRKNTKILIVALIVISILFNLGLSLMYRHYQMNLFIPLDEARDFFENNYKNSTLEFYGDDTFFYPMIGSKSNNSYVPRQNILRNNTNRTFMLEWHSKNENSKLDKTFVKGPYCMMIYKLKSDDNIEANESNYCSVEIKTRFIYPQNIELNAVVEQNGKQKNITNYIKPPWGKLVHCEYLCFDSDEDLKIKSIKIMTKNNIFNKILDVKFNLAE